MRISAAPLRLALTSAVLLAMAGAALTAVGAAEPVPGPTPGIRCAPGSLPERTQGRAPLEDVASGRYAKGYTCNVQEIGHTGVSGGYRVERYVDAKGNECAYYDSTLLVGRNVPDQGFDGPGTYVLDMKDPRKPTVTAVLRTPAMVTPHESVRLNQKRGLLVAAFGTPATLPGVIDVYDVKDDCRTPRLLASAPSSVLGHEGGFSPDGNTYWVASLYFRTLQAIDLRTPSQPRPVWTSTDYEPHGVSLSDDGNTLYMAEAANDDSRGFSGLTILDVSQVQSRREHPKVPVVSRLTWGNVSTPQNSTPFTKNGRRYVLHTDEFGSGASIGGARIIDVNDPRKPSVVSTLRLAVNQPEIQPQLDGDPGNSIQFQGYQAHYCSLPSRVDPTIVACTFIMSGLRVFDISNPRRPVEIAYHSKPVVPGGERSRADRAGTFAMSAPAYDEATGDIWYSDGNSGFYVVRLAGPARRAKFASRIVLPGN